MEVSINNCFVGFLILRAEPFVDGVFRVPATVENLSFETFFKALCFVKHTVVYKYISGVNVIVGKIPVAFYFLNVRIVITKNCIIDSCYIGGAIVKRPVVGNFGTCDDCTVFYFGNLADSGIFKSCVTWIYVLSVNTGSYDNLITGHCY